MRPRLLDRRQRPSRHRGHGRRAGAERGRQTAAAAETIEIAPAVERVVRIPCDPDVEKVRRAGGPLDQAVYSCACGYVFSSPVSTTVGCPHCGTEQAW